jgi:N-carbamoyl-L-amino-acid hydrolase
MPFLEQEHKDIGIVKGVTGIYREHISIRGEAGHCGTTPMAGRHDALCAASGITIALEGAARKEYGAVATIGRLEVFPNSVNTIPGRVEMDAEIRSYDPDASVRIINSLSEAVDRIEETRGVGVDRTVLYDTRPCDFSPGVRDATAGAAGRLGLTTLELVSMAGHDAAHMNDICEAGMIFVPSKGGLSHCPGEWTDAEDLVKGARCLLQTLLLLDQK